MKTQDNFFSKYFIYILLVSQLWVNIYSSFSLLFDTDSNIIELLISDKEIEDDNKEEKKDKIVYNFHFTFNEINFIKINNNFNKKEDFIPLNYIEINLPPPEHYFFYS